VQFAADVVGTGDAPDLRISPQIFENIGHDLNAIFRGLT
jgi:hypothetical protein